MEHNKEFAEANFHLVETWSDFVKVSLANGETVEGIRKRLASNNLSEEQIDLILDPNSRDKMLNQQGKMNGRYRLLGIFKLFVGLFFLMTITKSPISGLMIGISSLALSIMWFSQIKRIQR